MFFTGDTSKRRVGLGGKSGHEPTREALLEKSRREREARQRQREQTQAATTIQARWRQRAEARRVAGVLREEWAAAWDAAAASGGPAFLGAVLSDDRCLSSFLLFYTPGRGDDWRRMGAVCAALAEDNGKGLVDYMQQHRAQQQQQQQQQQSQQLEQWAFRLGLLARRCLESLAFNTAALRPLLASPRAACDPLDADARAGLSMIDCTLSLVSPDTWLRGCGTAEGGPRLAGTLAYLARTGAFLRLQQVAMALPLRSRGDGPPPLGEVLVTQVAVRCVALSASQSKQQQQQQQQQQQLQSAGPRGLLPLLCTPGLWQRCPSLAPAGPQLAQRALSELGPLPDPRQMAVRLSPGSDAPGPAAAALLANLLTLGERLAGGQSAPGDTPASAQVVAVLIALLGLVPDAALPPRDDAPPPLLAPRPLRPARTSSQSGGGSDGGATADEPTPFLPWAAVAAEGGRLAWPEGVPVDSCITQALADLGGDAGLALLRRLVAAELPLTSATPTGGGTSPWQPERAWQACRLVMMVLTALPHVPRLRALLVLSVAAQLPARVWFSLLRPLQRGAGSPTSSSGGQLTTVPALGPPVAAGALGSSGRAAWGDPGWQAPLAVLALALGSFLSTADASDLGTALPLAEVFDATAPSVGLLPLLRQTLWQALVSEGDQPAASSVAAALRGSFAASSGTLLAQLAELNHRLEFCPPGAFVADGYSSERFLSEAAATQLRLGAAGGRQRLAQLMRSAPYLVPFEDRVQLLQHEIAIERHNAAEAEAAAQVMAGGDPWSAAFGGAWGDTRRFVAIRRDRIVEDGFAQLNGLGTDRLRGRVRIQYIDEHGTAEAGIDGGGLFKDFMDELLRQGFNPEYGLFAATPQRELYPDPASLSVRPDAAALLEFLGRMLGKAMYEGVLLELPLAGFFLKKFTGRRCDLGDLASLDPEVHRHLLALRHYTGDFSDLSLTFSVAEGAGPGGGRREVELKPGGLSVPVTAANVVEYVHRVADHRLNRQMAPAVSPFLRGFFDIVRPGWVAPFAAWELAALISGRDPGECGLDIADMRANTVYAGGYHDEGHPIVEAFWAAVASFTPAQQRALLRFITGCSRPPLLGFAHLEPRLCIAMAGGVLEDGATERLPTSSACVNTLKLPPYADAARLREKLLYSITARAGFDLS